MCIYTSKITLGKPSHSTQRVLTRDVYLHQKNACTTARLLCICVYTSPRKRGIKQANRARGASSGISWASGTLRDWGPFPPLAPFPLSNLFNSLLLLGACVLASLPCSTGEREDGRRWGALCESVYVWVKTRGKETKQGGKGKGEIRKREGEGGLKSKSWQSTHTLPPPAVTQTSLQPPYKQLRHLWPQTHTIL